MDIDKKTQMDDNACQVELKLKDNMVLNLSGSCNLQKYPSAKYLSYRAGSPPDYRLSYSGSALPYPNKEVAYGNSVNCGTTDLQNGKFDFDLWYPNAYYVKLGTVLLEPHIHLQLVDSNGQILATKMVKVNRAVGNRSLTGLYCKPNRTTYR